MTLEHLLEVVDAELKESRRYVEKKLQDPKVKAEGLAEQYLEEVWTNEDLCIEAERLAMVGLYSKLELTMRVLLSRIYGKDVEEEELYKWNKLKKRLNLDFQVDVMKIRGSKTVDELRCLANSIKHEGRVNRELAQFRGWRRNKDIKHVRRHFPRMQRAAETFLRFLSRRLERELQNLCREAHT